MELRPFDLNEDIANAVFRSAINEQDFLREFIGGTVFVKSTYNKLTGLVEAKVIPSSEVYIDRV